MASSKVSVPHAFYLGMAALAALVVFLGFAPTYYLSQRFGGPVLSPLVHLHGALFTAWILLFGAQSMLVAAHRTRLHRRLGVAGALVASGMIVMGSVTAIESAKRGHSPIPEVPPLVFLVVPLADIVVFALLAAAGIAMRRRPDFHARLMLLATIGILGPAIARMRIDVIQHNNPIAFMLIVTIIVITCAAYDALRLRRVHPAYLWGGLLVILSQPARLALGRTEAWMSFAQWLTG